jgi:hypothetical protein
LLQVVDIVGADGIFPVGMFEKLFGGNNHRFIPFSVI